ncbi:MAG: hypothetical protein ACC634_07645, partial [Hyphomicrobiales bacterium]
AIIPADADAQILSTQSRQKNPTPIYHHVAEEIHCLGRKFICPVFSTKRPVYGSKPRRDSFDSPRQWYK